MKTAREHVLKWLDSGTRYDGRKLDEFRKVTIELGASKNAEGSSRVIVGDTEILAGVKMAIETPYPDTPDQGNLMVNVELTPLSNPEFESGPPSDQAVEVARIIDRGIRESKFIDVKKLCITPKESVWGVIVDVVTINTQGNLIDVSALAALAAIKEARLPKREERTLKYDQLTNEKLPLDTSKMPVTVTVYKIGKHLLVDPIQEEEEVAEARLSVAVLPDGSIVAMQKGGEYSITADEVDAMVALAQSKASELRKLLK